MSNAVRKSETVSLAPLPGPRLASPPMAASALSDHRLADAGGDRRQVHGQETGRDGVADGERIGVFVAGPENELVAAIVNRLIADLNRSRQEPAENPLPGPLVLLGPSGSGKTHLAFGLAMLWAAKRGSEEVGFFTAADFARDFATAIDQDAVRSWRRSLRRKQLLVIDDAHRLGDSDHKATELRHTLDGVAEHGGRVLLTFNGPPSKSAAFDRPLLSRLAEGLMLEVSPPGRQARRELLRHAARASGCEVDEAALDALADNLPADARGVVRAAIELRRRSGRTVDATGASSYVQDTQPDHSTPLKDILRVTARYHQVPLRVLTSASRKQAVVTARAIAIYLARELTPLSYAQIGQALGGRDHTTIMHNYRRIAREMPRDLALKSAIEELHRLLAQ